LSADSSSFAHCLDIYILLRIGSTPRERCCRFVGCISSLLTTHEREQHLTQPPRVLARALTHARTHARTRTHTHTHTHMHTYAHTHTHMQAHARTRARTHARAHTRTRNLGLRFRIRRYQDAKDAMEIGRVSSSRNEHTKRATGNDTHEKRSEDYPSHSQATHAHAQATHAHSQSTQPLFCPSAKKTVEGKIYERTRRQMALDRGIEMERDGEGERE
jgi:leucyl aminopeptidase (aminopeptidase T)